MVKINQHSLEWQAVLEFIKKERSSAIDRLIADEKSEQQRGKLQILARLEGLAKAPPEIVQTDTYN